MANRGRETFAVPAGAGDFAPEVLYCAAPTTDVTKLHQPDEFQALIEELPTAAEVVVEHLRVEGDPTDNADWVEGDVYTYLGLTSLYAMLAQPTRVRVRSGGNAGSATVSARWRTRKQD